MYYLTAQLIPLAPQAITQDKDTTNRNVSCHNITRLALMTGTPTTDNEKPQAWKGGCLSTRPDTVQEAKTFFLLQSKLQLLRGQMSSLVSISSPSDTVSTQEMGISAHTTQCLSIHNPFGLHTKSPASE